MFGSMGKPLGGLLGGRGGTSIGTGFGSSDRILRLFFSQIIYACILASATQKVWAMNPNIFARMMILSTDVAEVLTAFCGRIAFIGICSSLILHESLWKDC